MNAAIALRPCPRCGCLSVIEDLDQAEVTDFCTVCGYYAGEDYQCDLPHFNYSYSFPDIDPCNLADVRDVHGEPDIHDLDAAQAWLRACEKGGYKFAYFVVADSEGVHWLRGNSTAWNCK